MSKNSADAIQARVDNMYTDESFACVYTDVMYLLLENKRLREALAFYVDKDNYRKYYSHYDENDPLDTTSNVQDDEGERARKALGGE